ncbi:MAG: PilZ domain-containing protein [Spirochaetaceae bacterium]
MGERKRDTTRVEFHTLAELRSGSQSITGKVEDLSLKGMFLRTEGFPPKLEEGGEVSITIKLSGTGSDLSFGLEGEVVRLDKEGVGIKFTEMEFDSFVHLRNIVTYNSGDEEKIMEEFHRTLEE